MKSLIEELGPEEKQTEAFEFWLEKMWKLHSWLASEECSQRMQRTTTNPPSNSNWLEIYYFVQSEGLLYIRLRSKLYKAHKITLAVYNELLSRYRKHDILEELQRRYDLIPVEDDWCDICDKRVATIHARLADVGYEGAYVLNICERCKDEAASGDDRQVLETTSLVRNPRRYTKGARYMKKCNPEPLEKAPWYVQAAKDLTEAVFEGTGRPIAVGGHIQDRGKELKFKAYSIFDDEDKLVGLVYSTEVIGLSYVEEGTSYFLRICRGKSPKDIIYQRIIDNRTTKEQFQSYVEQGMALLRR
jgi:hypothetical protein